jgi:hypothetical protein
LCEALLRNTRWLGKPCHLAEDRRVIFFCEDRSSTSRVRAAFKGSGMENRVVVLVLHRWAVGASLAELAKKTSAGLVVIDSVYPAVGDVNDQARADAFLGAIQALDVPVVVVHHEAKDGSSGTPAGVQRFRAAYRQTIRVKKCTQADSDRVLLELDVSGNDVPGKSAFTVAVGRRSLVAEIVESVPLPPGISPGRQRRAKRMAQDEKAAVLGALARKAGHVAGLRHTEYATAMLGGSRGNEKATEQTAVAAALGLTSITHRTVASLIQEYPDAFRSGLSSAEGTSAA